MEDHYIKQYLEMGVDTQEYLSKEVTQTRAAYIGQHNCLINVSIQFQSFSKMIDWILVCAKVNQENRILDLLSQFNQRSSIFLCFIQWDSIKYLFEQIPAKMFENFQSNRFLEIKRQQENQYGQYMSSPWKGLWKQINQDLEGKRIEQRNQI